MKENSSQKSSKLDVKSIIIIVLAICLFASFALSLVLILRGKSIVIPANTNATSSESDIPSEPERETIDMEKFKAYAAQYNVSAEYLQRFFDDVIVYKNDDGIQYSPIDGTLPKSNYNWNNLSYLENEIQYVENGEPTSIKGIDVSVYQGLIDWKKVAADGVKFAIIRIGVRGYGTGDIIEDKYWKRNLDGAINAGIEVGAYFYSQAITVEEAVEEAQFVTDRIKGYELSYPVVYDFEEILDESRTDDLTPQQRTDFTLAFCKKVEEAGFKPSVYGNIKWFLEMVEMERLTEYDKWFAQYFKTPFFPYDFQMWQYTGKGKVDGIEGDVDLNISFKDYAPTSDTGSDS